MHRIRRQEGGDTQDHERGGWHAQDQGGGWCGSTGLGERRMEMYRIKGRKVGMHRISREEGGDAQDHGVEGRDA